MNQSANTTADPHPDQQAAPASAAGHNGKRKRLLWIILLLVIVAAIAGWLYWLLLLKNYVSTDDAYVAGNVVQITPQINGTVIAIDADDTDYVQAGKPLIRIDSTDADVALSQAEAALAQAVRQTRTLYANNSTLAANISQRAAEVKRAQTDLRKARDDYQRRAAVASQGAVSGEELQHAKDAVDSASNAYAAARAGAASASEQLTSNTALTDGIRVQDHPSVKQAAAAVRSAYLNKTRCEILSPVTGLVGKRSVQLGQRVTTGSPLMAVVPLDQVWVDANFKESQLRDVRIGQSVHLVSDIYGSKIEYHGRVEGFSAATGSAFSLLPAQNATGNWIKIVQRLPVRIALDKEQLRAHPLRIGLSMDVEVDISQHDGKLLADSSQVSAVHATRVFEAKGDAAQQLIDTIIADNLGQQRASPRHAHAAASTNAGA